MARAKETAMNQKNDEIEPIDSVRNLRIVTGFLQ
jgi:hypothetical protein